MNNILDYIATASFLFVESACISYLITVLTSLLTKTNSNKKLKNFFYLLGTLYIIFAINRIIHVTLPSLRWIKSIIFIVGLAFSLTWIQKIKLLKGFIISVICSFISAVLEIIIALILNELSISPELIVTNTIYNSFYACLISLFEVLIGFIIHLFNKSLASVENKLKYFVPQLIGIIICLLPTMFLFMINDFKYSNVFIVVNAIQLITITLIGLFNLKFVAKHEDTEAALANTITYNETLKKVNEGVRGFKHDMGNIVQAILGYIAVNDAEGAKNYCQNLVLGFNDINVLSILSPTVIDNPAIYGVVVNKILIAREKDMSLTLDVTTTVSDINFPKFELSRILGILIDNAIEAGEETKDKKLIVNIRHDYNYNRDIITISNSVNNTNIDVDKIFTKNYSTKQNPSGFGLYEVAKFLKKYPQGYITTTIDEKNKLFTQTLTINRF